MTINKAPKHFCPSAINSYFYTLTSNPFLNMNLISSLDFTIASCTRLPQIPASNSWVKPSCFYKVRMNPLNNSLFAFLLSICICSEIILSSVMLSCKSLSSESVSQTISIITLVLARISSFSENNSFAALMNNSFNSSSLMCGVLHLQPSEYLLLHL